MRLTRTTALAALVVVALAAPVAAFALDGDDGPGAEHRNAHATKTDQHASSHPGHATGRERAAEASAAGKTHAEEMKAWAHCVAEAASGAKIGEHTGPPKDACEGKPVGPGRAKHESAGPASPPGNSAEHPRGQSGTHRSH